jgi:hypothetical protein
MDSAKRQLVMARIMRDAQTYLPAPATKAPLLALCIVKGGGIIG